ncbi:MAG TPA: outer membrane beta-barrel protein [Chryseosolibacter sp.]
MKRTVTLLLSIALWQVAAAQVNLTPYAGMNSTRIYDGISYQNGGAFAVTGFEIEVAKNTRNHRMIYLSLATGASYLSNGFYYSSNFAYAAVSLYTQRITDLRMQNVQIPVTLRLNWQPFPLVEDWKVFLGIGICNNMLIRATLKERYTEVYLNEDLLAPPTVTSYEDAADVTDYGKKNNLFTRIELGMKYKRLQLSYRLSKSLSDLYYTGLEADWHVPEDNSWYLEAHRDAGKIIEKYSELVVGFRIGRK